MSVHAHDDSQEVTPALELAEAIPAVYESHIMDPRGDLWVTFRGTGSWGSSGPLRFQVCSRALARTSPVLDRMLYGPFAESKRSRSPSGKPCYWEISLSELPPLALRQLFEIMHCRSFALEPANTVRLRTSAKVQSRSATM